MLEGSLSENKPVVNEVLGLEIGEQFFYRSITMLTCVD